MINFHGPGTGRWIQDSGGLPPMSLGNWWPLGIVRHSVSKGDEKTHNTWCWPWVTTCAHTWPRSPPTKFAWENQVLGRKSESISIEKDWLMDQDLEPRNSVTVDTEDLMRTASGHSERTAFWKKCRWQTAMREEVTLDQHFITLEYNPNHPTEREEHPYTCKKKTGTNFLMIWSGK